MGPAACKQSCLSPELCVGIPGHPHRELARVEVVHQLVALHVLLPGDKGQLLDVLLIVGLLPTAKLLDEPLGLVLVLVVDQLEVHVHKHRVQDQRQLVAVDIQRALHKPFQIADEKYKNNFNYKKSLVKIKKVWKYWSSEFLDLRFWSM